ncbi:hypothetical protein P171DRAFT_362683 [Karstenula rhodostoma CBS 690.94]|uniref:Uncharacterized protein n=1 Tax=Karstenula rhodostoma CBS 690.94 TaxID=1392251 RepID=A0A9P4PEQ4_9PLEO|nr:hypothetical protein P171DRAFT_362683 [Karstenula rhodostoma CBS 690.94]
MPADSFTGPSCKDLVEFMKSVKDIPVKHKDGFEGMSEKAIETVCDVDALHVWESGDDIDDFLHLTQVIVKLKIEAEKHEGRRRKEPAMVIISSEQATGKNGRDGFERICEVVRNLMKSDGKKHLDDTVCAFDAVVVVRGIDYTSSSDNKAAVKRINTAIERVFKMQRPSVKQLVWHHGPILSLLLTWIDNTTSDLRSALTAISITAALDLTDGVKPSPLGKANKQTALQTLEDYAKRLDIPVVFVDPASQLITYEYLATYMYYWAYYIHVFLPSSALRPHFYAALDALVTFCFRLRGASDSTYGASTVRMVQEHLSASTARRWASTSIDPSSYTKDLCRATATDAQIHHAVQLADSPFALLSPMPGYPLPAFSRLPLCPSDNPADSTGDFYIAAPVSFTLPTGTFRASSSSPFYVLLPREGRDVDKVTAWIQGSMMGVLERLRRDKDVVRINKKETELYGEVARACGWALDGCRGKMPEGVEGKVKFVREKVRKGTFCYVSGLVKETEGSRQKGRSEGGWLGGQVGWGAQGETGWVDGAKGGGGGGRRGRRGGWMERRRALGGVRRCGAVRSLCCAGLLDSESWLGSSSSGYLLLWQGFLLRTGW